ncbi:hypothetical protein FACS189490_10320 [Clostridia bacterium]|nr:hypothetical protein FACS189490_10320 [Clostridia bacterium]
MRIGEAFGQNPVLSVYIFAEIKQERTEICLATKPKERKEVRTIVLIAQYFVRKKLVKYIKSR